MLDLGFSELGVIGVVALIVIGPEQLPKVARTAGHMMGRLRRYVSDVKADIGREMEAADFQRAIDEVKDSALSFETSMREQVADLDADLHNTIGLPEMHELVEQPIAQVLAEARLDSADPFQSIEPARAEDVSQSVALSESPAEVIADPNQLDMFGMPLSQASNSSGKD